tara:strand:- start:351 stop:1418 length:1068 start_codon:yes stop_codon:yes gene_type:complete
MITVYGPNGESIRINARAVNIWLQENPGWSLDNPKTSGKDESEDSIKDIDSATDIGKGGAFTAPASSITSGILDDYEKGVYYSGVPNVINNPDWDGKKVEEKYVPAQAAYPGLELIPSFEGDLYLNTPNFNAISIGNFQELLEDAGYLKGDFNPGSNDAPTKKAIRDWFNDVNGYRLNAYQTGQNINIDPVQFLGNQINNKFTSALQTAKEESAEFSKNVDRGKFLKDNLRAAIGNRRDFTSNELNEFRDLANNLIDEEIRNNLKMTEYKIKQQFGKIPTIESLDLGETEGQVFGAELEQQFGAEPESFNASEQFMNKVEPLFKSFRDRPERAERAEQNFQNVNRSILGGSMRDG